ncbi:MAG: hypothetical protein R3A48_09645 [Polyangiales bacterium]
MPPRDPLQLLRHAALEGLEARAPATLRRAPRRRVSTVPAIPEGEPRPLREELTGALWDDAERAWRRSTHAWVPSLRALRASGVTFVDVHGLTLRVSTRNAVHRASALPPLWVPVILAALTGRELQSVRRSLAASVSRFTPEDACPSP